MVDFFYGADVFYTDDYFSEARNLVEIDSYTRGSTASSASATRTSTGRWCSPAKNITDEEDNVSGIFAQNLHQHPHAAAAGGVHADLQGQLLTHFAASGLAPARTCSKGRFGAPSFPYVETALPGDFSVFAGVQRSP